MKDGRLEVSDLMIGDWVECTYWTPSKQLKVAEIRRIMDDEIKIGVYSDDLVLIFRQSEVKPIPLTPEILEKNGFTLEHYSGDVMTGYWWTRNDFIIHNSMNDAIGRNNFKYEYVHQLQHALRLCGIDKKIEL